MNLLGGVWYVLVRWGGVCTCGVEWGSYLWGCVCTYEVGWSGVRTSGVELGTYLCGGGCRCLLTAARNAAFTRSSFLLKT